MTLRKKDLPPLPEGFRLTLRNGELVGDGCQKGRDYLLQRIRHESGRWAGTWPLEIRNRAVWRMMQPEALKKVSGETVGSYVARFVDFVLDIAVEEGSFR